MSLDATKPSGRKTVVRLSTISKRRPSITEPPIPVAGIPGGRWTLVLLSTTWFSVLAAYFLATLKTGVLLFDPDESTTSYLSNGTHLFGRTVVLVSFDGLRSDYLDRGLAPHLMNISRQGVHAEYMKAVFPTLTFPNHWTLLTGLYAESHGIIANDFHDPQYCSAFVNNQPGAGEPRWWLGEPIWETVERAGFYSANIMWPGPSISASGVTPKYSVPFVPFYLPEERISQVLEWIDLPLEQRPRLILVYEPMLDQAGHAAGPDSKLETLPTISNFAHTLVEHLHHERNLSHIVDLLFVSDHGMEDTSAWEMVYMDDILCHEQDAREKGWPACAGIQHVDGWPSMGFWFQTDVNTTAVLSRLVSASKSGKFDVYTTDTYSGDTPNSTIIAPTMPERYHYASSPRLAPIWVVPRIGYALTDHVENGSLMSIGNHGYDNDAPAMRAVFISQGPFAERVRKRMGTDTRTYALPPFGNVEIYNLVVRLLGIEEWAPDNNGTVGFWDRWTTI